MNEGFEAPLRIANKKHDVVAVRIHDKREEELPNVGLVQMKDAEKEISNGLTLVVKLLEHSLKPTT